MIKKIACKIPTTYRELVATICLLCTLLCVTISTSIGMTEVQAAVDITDINWLKLLVLYLIAIVFGTTLLATTAELLNDNQ